MLLRDALERVENLTHQSCHFRQVRKQAAHNNAIMPSRIIFVVYLSHFLLCYPLTGMVISRPGRVLSIHTPGVVIRQASILLMVVKLEIKGHLSCRLHEERYLNPYELANKYVIHNTRQLNNVAFVTSRAIYH